MAPAVLIITGAWHVPAHYAKITQQLTAKGHRVLCPQLPSNNNAYPPNKYLEDDVAFIRSLVADEAAAGTQLTVLVHSWGGIVSSAGLSDFAMDAATPGKGGVANLIFMAAFIPMEGDSLAGIFGGTLPPYLHAHPDDTLRWDDPEMHLYNDLAPEEAAAMEALRVWHSAKAQHTPVACETVAWRVLPVSYIYCELDQGLPVGVQEMMVGRIKGEGVRLVREFRVQAGHSAQISRPDDIVAAVEEVMTSK